MRAAQDLTELVRGKLTGIQRKSIVALVTQDVHNRDIIETLCTNEVTNVNDFTWQQQLRYYWDMQEDDCVIRQVDASMNYGHEYQGATTRLVITPLTDRYGSSAGAASRENNGWDSVSLGSFPQGGGPHRGTARSHKEEQRAKCCKQTDGFRAFTWWPTPLPLRRYYM